MSESPTPETDNAPLAAPADTSSADRSEEGSAPPPAPARSEVRLVKIKFRSAGRHYDFNALNLTLTQGNKVVVETDRGRALGEVVGEPYAATPGNLPDGLKNVIRHATTEDLNMAATYTAREATALSYCRERVAERRMEMKLVRAEYLFDGSKIIFYFTADGRVDFRELVKDLAHHFHTRIEMRQIGVRDEAKLTGGIGVCGRELCCCSYLTEFAPVSVKMAKEQGLALNPAKISGQCGRLLCCLAYEYDTYCDLKKCLPKCGRKVTIAGREGEVVEQHLLKQTVTVAFAPNDKVVLTAEEIESGVMPQRSGPAPLPPSLDRNSGGQSHKNGERPQRETRSAAQGSRPQQRGQQAQPSRQGGTPQPPPSGRPQQARSNEPAPPQRAETKPQGAAPQRIKSAQPQQQPPQPEGATENRRKRHRNRRRSGRKPAPPTTSGGGDKP